MIYIIGIFSFILFIDVPHILQLDNKRKTLITYLILISIAFILNILQIKNKLPMSISPSKIIEKIIKFLVE